MKSFINKKSAGVILFFLLVLSSFLLFYEYYPKNKVLFSSEQSNSFLFKVGLIEDFPFVSQEEEISLAESLARDKSLDLIVFHENFFNAFSGTDYIVLNKIKDNKYEVSSSSSMTLSYNVFRLTEISKNYKTNIVFVAKVNIENEGKGGIAALVINTNGEIVHVYFKFEEFNSINLSNKEGYNVSAFIQICGGPGTYYQSIPSKNLKSDLYIHPSWGGEDILILAVMEYNNKGYITDETFNFLSNSLSKKPVFSSLGITSKEFLENKIKNSISPFDWPEVYRNLLSGKDLKETGFIITADQLNSNGILGMPLSKIRNIEYGRGFEYIYAELEIPISYSLQKNDSICKTESYYFINWHTNPCNPSACSPNKFISCETLRKGSVFRRQYLYREKCSETKLSNFC